MLISIDNRIMVFSPNDVCVVGVDGVKPFLCVGGKDGVAFLKSCLL